MTSSRASLGLSLLSVGQASVYVVGAVALSERWVGDAVLFGLAAALQVLGLRRRWEPWCHLGSLVLLLAVVGRFGASAMHVHRVFGPVAAQAALGTLAGAAAALPWLFAFPVARIWLQPPGRVVALLPLALLPALEGLRPYAPLPAAERVEEVAAALWSGAVPSLPADAIVRVTRLNAGVPTDAVTSGGEDLVAPAPSDALIVDIASMSLPMRLLRLGVDAPVEGPSPAILPRTAARSEVIPGLYVPRAKGQATLRWRSALVSDAGVVLLERGWAPGPAAFDSPTIDAAVQAGAAQLVRNQAPDGRFTYIVRGPSGEPGKGYNYPRHAGTAWFLARVWVATGDTVARDGARAALAHLSVVSKRAGDRAWVLDPDRKDGKSWIGTTALAALAWSLIDPTDPMFDAYVAQIAASVDLNGKVLGDMDLATASFPDQPVNSYGQGQAMLALAAAERVGHTGGRDALTRAVTFLESGAYVGTAHPIVVGDEHWICLSARAIRDVRGVDAGSGICDAYVATERWSAPPPGAGIVPATGPGAGGAEALVARAWDTRSAALIDASLAWARVFLAAQYRAADAPLLGRPDALIGAFRDTVGDLDVQIDAVQHIGCALLGAEALLAGRARPGSLP